MSSKQNRAKSDTVSRAVRNKQLRQEELRKKLQGLEYIRQLELCAKEYDSIIDDLNKAKTAKAKLTRKDKEELAMISMKLDILAAKRDTLKQKVDLNLRRLKFVLPELKAVELSDPEGNSPLAGLVGTLRDLLGED